MDIYTMCYTNFLTKVFDLRHGELKNLPELMKTHYGKAECRRLTILKAFSTLFFT